MKGSPNVLLVPSSWIGNYIMCMQLSDCSKNSQMRAVYRHWPRQKVVTKTKKSKHKLSSWLLRMSVKL